MATMIGRFARRWGASLRIGTETGLTSDSTMPLPCLEYSRQLRARHRTLVLCTDLGRSHTGPRSVIDALSGEDVCRLHERIEVLAREIEHRHASLISVIEQAGTPPTGHQMELRRLATIAEPAQRVADVCAELADVRAIAKEPNASAELIEMAQEEELVLQRTFQVAAADVLDALVTKEYDDLKNLQLDSSADEGFNSGEYAESQLGSTREVALMEIRAGTGGEEAALFVSDLFNMYFKYASRRNWKCRIISLSETSLGGCREVVLRIEGRDVYKRLRLEAGVHRVQRVPLTETAGRIHTSAVSVAVLRDDASLHKKVQINESDIRVDVYRASGAGGQHVNKTESAVRLTHIPTGIVTQSQDERSQHRNRATAMDALIARLAAKAAAEAAATKVAEREAQLGNALGYRSDRIRTFNYPQRRVTDHRIGVDSDIAALLPSLEDGAVDKNAPLDAILEGAVELDILIDAVHRQVYLDLILSLVRRADGMSLKTQASDCGGKRIARSGLLSCG